LSLTAPNSLLHMLGEAQAGTQEARAFSERVFPLARTEQEGKARSFYEEQIKELNDKITSIKSQRQGLLDSRLNDLIPPERTYSLTKPQKELDKIKAQHDWDAAKRSLDLDTKKYNLAVQQFGQQTKYQKGQLGLQKSAQQLQQQKINQQAKQWADKFGLDQQ